MHFDKEECEEEVGESLDPSQPLLAYYLTWIEYLQITVKLTLHRDKFYQNVQGSGKFVANYLGFLVCAFWGKKNGTDVFSMRWFVCFFDITIQKVKWKKPIKVYLLYFAFCKKDVFAVFSE